MSDFFSFFFFVLLMEEIDNSNNNKKRKIEHKCSYCEKTYKKLCKLAEHERSHTGEVGLFV